jgi:hypothetical protein
MLRIATFITAALLFLSARAAVPASSPAHTDAPPSLIERRYARAHSLGDDYIFNPRDGWTNVTTSNLLYKYATPRADDVGPHIDTAADGLVARGVQALSDTLKSLFKGLKGTGKPEDVVITWYTGHDLENPSCWANTNWAPTVCNSTITRVPCRLLREQQDESFACALTMEGWEEKPACFKFLERASAAPAFS